MANNGINRELVASMDAANLFIRDISTKKTLQWINYLNNFKVEATSNSQYAKAKGKNATEFFEATEYKISGDSEHWNIDLIALINSEIPEDGVDNVGQRNEATLNVKDGVITISGTPVDDKVEVVVLANDGVSHLRRLDDATFDPSTKEITCTGGEAGENVAIYYLEKDNLRGFSVRAIPENTMYVEVEGTIRQKLKSTGKTTFLNLLAKKVSLSPNMSLSFDTANPTGFTIEMTVLEDANGDLIRWATLSESNNSDVITPTPISDLTSISTIGTSTVLTFSKPTGATSIKVQYTDDDGVNWKDTILSGSSKPVVSATLTEDSNNVTVENLSSGTTYKFRLVVTGGLFSGTSNETQNVVIA